MASLYPAQLLVLPLHAQHRLPPALQGVDLEAIMAVHAAIALLASNFWVHEPWALPLSLFGLIACVPSLSPSLLPHFLAMWIVSVPLDVIWLLHRSDQARSIIITLMGFNMCLKVVSASQAARILQSQGAIPDVGSASYGFGAQQHGWLGGAPSNVNSATVAAHGNAPPFGLPGSWSQQASYRDAPRTQTQPSAAPYRSIYDEEADAQDADAPQVHIDSIANSVATAAQAQAQSRGGNSTGNEGKANSQYKAVG